MVYTIEFTFDESNSASLSLDTNKRIVKLTSYSTEMDFNSFIQFADGVQEIRKKLTKTNGTDQA